MELRKDIPNLLEDFIEEVKTACGLEECVRLQYKDTDFDNTFVNLTSTTIVKDLTILKVIEMDPHSETVVLYPATSTPLVGLESDDSSVSAATDDTILLSSSSSDSLRTQQWPKTFPIQHFSYDTECQLQRGNAEYTTSQTKLTLNSKMLSDILEKLAEIMYTYTPYPEDSHFSNVAAALTRKHPCLREPGSFNESFGWKCRMKMKMANDRTQHRTHRTSAELTMNPLKSKSQEDTHPAKNLKRPRRAEVNHFPSLPSGETTETLEQERISLLAEVQKRNNRQTIKEKMAKTFGYRRLEIVHKQPNTEDIFARWPALFQMEEINAEFMRVTTVPLEMKFLAQLDKHSTKMLEVIRNKGGRVKQQTTRILQVFDETMDITIRRECIFKSLMIYLGEPVENLIKECQDMQGSEADQLEQATMAIFLTGKEEPFYPPQDIQIVIDGTPVLNQLPSVATTVAMLFGLTYALNLKYPKTLQYTFEFVQKVLMELGGNFYSYLTCLQENS